MKSSIRSNMMKWISNIEPNTLSMKKIDPILLKFVLVFVSMNFFSAEILSQDTPQDVLNVKRELLSKAIELGEIYEIDLDFSDGSISQVEFILSDLNSVYEETKNDEGLNGIAYILGFYIIEVIERNHETGRIERNHPQVGENTYPFYWNDSVLFPVGWCQKRIFDGDGDNVNFKYQVAVLDEIKK